MFPMDMQYNKQPDFSIVLEQYKQTPLENGRIDTEERLKIKITGGLFMQTFDIAEYISELFIKFVR